MTRPDDCARRVQDFETPQGRAARALEREEHLERQTSLALVFVIAVCATIAATALAVLVLTILPTAAATFAEPLANNPY